MKKKATVVMSSARLTAILKEQGIPRELWRGWKALVNGKSVYRVLGEVLAYRFYHDRKYRKCFNAIIGEISAAYLKEVGISFPPPEYQAPCSYESLCCKAS